MPPTPRCPRCGVSSATLTRATALHTAVTTPSLQRPRPSPPPHPPAGMLFGVRAVFLWFCERQNPDFLVCACTLDVARVHCCGHMPPHHARRFVSFLIFGVCEIAAAESANSLAMLGDAVLMVVSDINPKNTIALIFAATTVAITADKKKCKWKFNTNPKRRP